MSARHDDLWGGSMSELRIALSQINLTVGDIDGNATKIASSLDRARESRVDVVLFPELTLTGYPPEDLLLKPRFVTAARAALQGLLPLTRGLTAVVGFPDRQDDLYNAAAVLHDGRVAGVYHKKLLPNYSVFDEDRYFAAGDTRLLFERPLTLPTDSGVRMGVSICEDIWYPAGPPDTQAAAGAEVLLAISASPYQSGKTAGRERMLATRATDNVAVVAFCNLVGGQDELVFDGGSVIVDERGEIVARARTFDEDFVVADIDVANVLRQRLSDPRRRKDKDAGGRADGFETRVLPATQSGSGARPAIDSSAAPRLGPSEEVYEALVLATRDYTRKNGFEKVVLGLSGGIDSALVAAIAVDALGAENVVCVSMPSRYSSEHSKTDAAELAQRLGVRLETIPIEPAHRAYLEMLASILEDGETGVAEENLQSRARGNVLMAFSNRFGWLVLTTGNKSELAVGYATIYGDMAGGFAVIKDVPKGWVYRLCRYRNELGPVIPESILNKPPSAELAPDQQDSDTLPDYEELDAILAAYVERDHSAAEIVAQGHAAETVRRVIEMVDRNEYKRRQAAPGPKITGKAFGKDRRLPITNRYRSARALVSDS
jgi:NAD+ synthase (glutamine-hydrolysing)